MNKAKVLLKRALGIEAPPQSSVKTNSLFYWRPRDGRHNFGDHLSSAIAVKMAAERGMFFDEEVNHPHRLLAIGSILHYAKNDNVIWGTGFNGSVPVERHQYDGLDVRAVRGPLTAEFLEKRGIFVPSVFGDPALLTKRLLGARFPTKVRKRSVSFVPNFADLVMMEGWENVVSPYGRWADVIAEIASSELVISTSLHGLIIADTFGVPCTYLRLSETESLIKYEDYCLGAGRSGLTVTSSLADATKATPMDPIRPDLDALYNAFPWDLWN